MTREEERINGAIKYANSVTDGVQDDAYFDIVMKTHLDATKWADEHPKEGLVSIDKACEWLEYVNLDYYQIREGVFSRELVEDFRKAMNKL